MTKFIFKQFKNSHVYSSEKLYLTSKNFFELNKIRSVDRANYNVKRDILMVKRHWVKLGNDYYVTFSADTTQYGRTLLHHHLHTELLPELIAYVGKKQITPPNQNPVVAVFAKATEKTSEKLRAVCDDKKHDYKIIVKHPQYVYRLNDYLDHVTQLTEYYSEHMADYKFSLRNTEFNLKNVNIPISDFSKLRQISLQDFSNYLINSLKSNLFYLDFDSDIDTICNSIIRSIAFYKRLYDIDFLKDKQKRTGLTCARI